MKLTPRNAAAIAPGRRCGRPYGGRISLTPLCALMKLEPEELPQELREIHQRYCEHTWNSVFHTRSL